MKISSQIVPRSWNKKMNNDEDFKMRDLRGNIAEDSKGQSNTKQIEETLTLMRQWSVPVFVKTKNKREKEQK